MEAGFFLINIQTLRLLGGIKQSRRTTRTISKRALNPARLLTILLLLLPAAILGARGQDETAPGQEMVLEREFPADRGGLVEVLLYTGGNISISGWERDTVHIRAEKKGRNREDCWVSFKESGRGVRVEAEGDKRNRDCSVDITIDAPVESDIRLLTMGGEIELADLKGETEAETMGGAVEIKGLEGTIELTTMGGSIQVADSLLDGRVKTMGGRIVIDNVRGDLDASTMGGEVVYKNRPALESSDGEALSISTMGGPVNVDSAPFGVEASTMGGAIHIKSARVYTRVKTMGGSITIDDIDGWVEAATMGGNVTVVMTGDPEQGRRDVDISSMGGTIRLTVPRDLAMDVDLELNYTRGSGGKYKIISDFDLTLEETENQEKSPGKPGKTIRARGRTGDGRHRIIVSTVNGDIYFLAAE
jgi:DUF4097 and DUF4098 domain-containing protein YvlB